MLHGYSTSTASMYTNTQLALTKSIGKGWNFNQTSAFLKNLQLHAVEHLWVQSVIADISEWSSQTHNRIENLLGQAVNRAKKPSIRIYGT
jgi:hypothetical protein